MKILLTLLILAIMLPVLSLALTIDCDDCFIDSCDCETNCNGIMRVWDDAGCEGIWDYEFVVTRKSVVWEPPVAGTYYASIFNGNEYCVNCKAMIVSSTTPTTSATTTTTTSADKVDCPYDCCEGMTGYTNKYCSLGEECVENECIESEGSSWWIWLLLILIIIGVVAFIFLRKKKRPSVSYRDLYRKWPRRLRRPRR